jgi:hypothetical protein
VNIPAPPRQNHLISYAYLLTKRNKLIMMERNKLNLVGNVEYHQRGCFRSNTCANRVEVSTLPEPSFKADAMLDFLTNQTTTGILTWVSLLLTVLIPILMAFPTVRRVILAPVVVPIRRLREPYDIHGTLKLIGRAKTEIADSGSRFKCRPRQLALSVGWFWQTAS